MSTEQGIAGVTGRGGSAAQAWSKYLEWNQAIADVIYPGTEDPGPAYMDLEEEELQKIAAAAGYFGLNAAAELASVVRAVTVGSDGKFSLLSVNANTRRWALRNVKQRSLKPPPCLAFLAVTVLAAEEMGRDEDLAAHAYYARLARLLQLSDNDSSLRNQYSRHAEYLWRCLNRWLEDLDGVRGLPTAYALTYRFVGLPMSQALVRHHDRRKFPSMFAEYGLSAGMRLAPEDLVQYLDAWLAAEGTSATANLRRLWARQDSHERVASITAVELANWDGTVASEIAATVTSMGARAAVVANLRSGFLGESLDLFLGIRPIKSDMDGSMEVRAVDGTWLSLGFAPGSAGLWRTAYTAVIDFRSMLDGVVQVRHAGDDHGQIYRHTPRMVVPLIYDELQSAFVEAERLQLGVDALLLVRSAGTTKLAAGAVEEVDAILRRYARPGFRKVESISGLPEGWVLFADVQMFGAPSASTRFNELLPMARNQLTIAGGLRIPSRIRKWSSLSPPEIRATTQSDTRLKVTLSGALGEDKIAEWSSETGALVISLDELALAEDDYQVALYCGTRTTAVQQATIRLRSSNNVDTQWSEVPRLTYSLSGPLGILTATEDGPGDRFVDGLVAEGTSNVPLTKSATAKISWSEPKIAVSTEKVEIGSPDPKSCVVTGAHRIQLPPALGGWAPKFIHGECTSCGLVKRYPGWLPSTGSRRRADGTQAVDDAPAVRVEDLREVHDHEVNWDAALDALMHLGGGSISSLQSIAMQLEGSALFVDNFIRAMELLGHVSIERDERWRPIRWEIAPSCLGQQSDSAFRLAGFWPSSLRIEVEKFAAASGGELLRKRSAGNPESTVLKGFTDDAVADFALDSVVAVVTQAGWSMLQALPRMSEVGAAIPRTTMPGFKTAAQFDLASACWAPTSDVHRSGAYRIRRGFETTYVYRSDSDVEAGTAAIAPVHLAKHLAANDRGKSLVGYQEKPELVIVPQGCDLPGLFGRAAVATAGQLPGLKDVSVKGRRRKCLVYKGIDRTSADLLVTLLST
ncbi:hypothetical protein C6A87_004415 [Mycobacterium sp. ITM-2016-00317]|uniref:hypothetical protein n=1 Tax=Mycobacterium sp. ITM-2016-00317 TaxID=2099694 RepID=UPI000D4B6686|nr:hypothetical protein [Mycobacterium sp. ITM-2016-00317]WNG88493.1 hypothetical protein C6A87_004415 [Mycobacterium sp. ITM-2016-00317]